MPRLEEQLQRLADQDRALPAGALIDQVERELHGGGALEVVHDHGALDTRRRRISAAAASGSRWRKGPVIAVATAIATLIAVGVPLSLMTGSDSAPITESATPTTTSINPAPTTIPPPSTVPAPATTIPATIPPPSTVPAPATTEPTLVVPGGLDIRFDAELEIVDPNSGLHTRQEDGVFTASGPAVDAGIVCASGFMTLGAYDMGLGTMRRTVGYHCDDGTGSFTLRLDLTGAYGDGGYVEEGFWTIDAGTGTYADLAGSGVDTAVLQGPLFVIRQTGQIADS